MRTLTQARRDQAREEREYRFAEARHLMSFGVHPDRLVAQLGTSRAALEKQARNHGASDIATYVQVQRPTFNATCDCGNEMSRNSKRCASCRAAKWSA